MSNLLGDTYVGIQTRGGRRTGSSNGEDKRRAIARIVGSGKAVRQAYEAANCKPPYTELEGRGGLSVAGHMVASIMALEGANPRAQSDAEEFSKNYGDHCVEIGQPEDAIGVVINEQ